MVFTYFKRARFYLNEFNRINFYLALYLASDIEEDVDEYKYEIFPWALGGRWRTKFSCFLKKRDALLRRIGYRAIVSRKCCEEVMSLIPDHAVWKRERSEDHGGATRAYMINRSKRILCSKTNIEEEELNLPRGPNEKPRPCPLCLVNRTTVDLNPCKKITPISQYIPTMFRGYSKYSDIDLLAGRTKNASSIPSSVSNVASYTHSSNNAKLNDQSVVQVGVKSQNQSDISLAIKNTIGKTPHKIFKSNMEGEQSQEASGNETTNESTVNQTFWVCCLILLFRLTAFF
jgi:hypothetical protein